MIFTKGAIFQFSMLLAVLFISSCAHKQLDSQTKSKIRTIAVELDLRNPIKPMLAPYVPFGQGGALGYMLETNMYEAKKSRYEKKNQKLTDFLQENNIETYIRKHLTDGIARTTGYSLVEPKEEIKSIYGAFTKVESKDNSIVDAYLRIKLEIHLWWDYSLLFLTAEPDMYLVSDGKAVENIYERKYQYQSLPIVTEEIISVSNGIDPELLNWKRHNDIEFQRILHSARINSWISNDGQILIQAIDEAIRELSTMFEIEIGKKNSAISNKSEKELLVIKQVWGENNGGFILKGELVSENNDRYIIRSEFGELISGSIKMHESAQQSGIIQEF